MPVKAIPSENDAIRSIIKRVSSNDGGSVTIAMKETQDKIPKGAEKKFGRRRAGKAVSER